LVAPFGGRTAANSRASPDTAEPGHQLAIFMPQPFSLAWRDNALKYFIYFEQLGWFKT
jgi:hypothetical protein